MTTDPKSSSEPAHPLLRSFRDPDGVLVFVDGTPIRLLRNGASETLWPFLESDTAGRLLERGAIVATERLSQDEITRLLERTAFREVFTAEQWSSVVRHEAVPFPSFASEWTPSMLHAAASLTRDLAEDLLSDGRGLKDATTHNVLFRGPEPVFVDLLSIEQRDPSDSVWRPYAQFVREFLIPLLLQRETGRPLRAFFSTGLDGVEPADAFRALSVWGRLRQPALTLVTVPVVLDGIVRTTSRTTAARRETDRERAQYMVRGVLRHLRRALGALTPSTRRISKWTRYADLEHPAEYFDAKRALIERLVAMHRPSMVLDVGCNTGGLSIVAARSGASVVAIDVDDQVVERLRDRALAKKLDILPLVVDIADPTPARGWENSERPSFLQRARSKFDLVVAMAILHHLLVSHGIPLDRVIELLASLSGDLVVLEFVPRTDPHFQQLTRGRDHLHENFTQLAFEHAIAKRFAILEQVALPVDGRFAYVLRKS